MKVNIAIVRTVPPSTFESYVASNISIEYAVNWDNIFKKFVVQIFFWVLLWIQRTYTNAFHISLDTLEPPYERGFLPCPFCCPRGLTMVSPLPRGDTSEWFVVGEDWWTAIATLFLCKINSTCRSVLYEWWRPPQAIHTAAQRQGSGPHRTYKAGIKQSLFSTGPCITHPHPHMNTQINQQGMHTDKHWLSVCGGLNGNPIQSHSLLFKFNSEGFSWSSKSLPLCRRLVLKGNHGNKTVSLHSDTALHGHSGQAPNSLHASKSDLMVLRDRLQHASEGWIALWMRAAYIDVMSPASRREVESEK